LLADAAGSFFPPVGAGAGNSGSPGAMVEYLQDLVQTNIITLIYSRNVHDGYVLDICLPILRLSPLPYSFDSDTSPPPLSPFRIRQSHWFHTIIMSRAELDRVFNVQQHRHEEEVRQPFPFFPSEWL